METLYLNILMCDAGCAPFGVLETTSLICLRGANSSSAGWLQLPVRVGQTTPFIPPPTSKVFRANRAHFSLFAKYFQAGLNNLDLVSFFKSIAKLSSNFDA
jgi:hypothetical protein